MLHAAALPEERAFRISECLLLDVEALQNVLHGKPSPVSRTVKTSLLSTTPYDHLDRVFLKLAVCEGSSKSHRTTSENPLRVWLVARTRSSEYDVYNNFLGSSFGATYSRIAWGQENRKLPGGA